MWEVERAGLRSDLETFEGLLQRLPRWCGMGESTGKLWRELRRRRVVSTAAAYAAAAFVLLQLAEILFPAFRIGPESLQALFWLLLTAFPAVIAFSWVFDVTRKGLKRTAPLEPEDGQSANALQARPRMCYVKAQPL